MAKPEKLKDKSGTIFSYTEQAHGDHIPGYAAVNRHADGTYHLTVRSSDSVIATAGLRIPDDQLKQLADIIAAELA